MTAIPYTFAGQIGPIPTAQLDANFSTLSGAGGFVTTVIEEGPFHSGTNFTPGVTTTLPLSLAYGAPQNVSVHFDTSYKGPDTYSLVGTNIVFNAPIPTGTNTVYVIGGVVVSGNAVAASDLASTTDATKGSALVGFLPAGVGAVGRTAMAKLRDRVSVEDFGAIGGTHDDTAAFQLALNYTQTYGGSLYAEQPLYTVSGLLTRNSGKAWSLIGGGKSVTEITTTNTANASILSTTSGHTTIKGIKFSCTGTPVAGTLLQIASDHILDGVVFRNYANGAALTGNVGIVRDSSLGDETGIGAALTSSIGITVNGYAGGLVFDNVVGFVPTVTPEAGIVISNCGACLLSNCNIIKQGNNLLINPGAAQTVASVQAINSYFDSAQNNNIALAPTTGGVVVRTYITQCECSSSSGNGILFDSTGGGSIDGVFVTAAQANLCAVNGIMVLGANTKNIDIVGGQCAANTGSGLNINASANNIRVTALTAGSGYGLSGNNTGIFIDSSASSVKLLGCIAQGNSANQITDGASSNIVSCLGHSSSTFSNFGDGLKIQFGVFTSSATPGAPVAVTFAKPFTVCIAVVPISNNSGSSNAAAWIDSPTNTGFNGHSAIATTGVEYLAIGI